MAQTKLTDEQRAVCAAVGVSEADFLKALEAAPVIQSELTNEQRAVCAAVGISEAAFLKVWKEDLAHGRA